MFSLPSEGQRGDVVNTLQRSPSSNTYSVLTEDWSGTQTGCHIYISLSPIRNILDVKIIHIISPPTYENPQLLALVSSVFVCNLLDRWLVRISLGIISHLVVVWPEIVDHVIRQGF